MADQPNDAPAPEAPRSFVTTHRGTFHGSTVDYRCLAGETHLPGADGEPHASIFTFSYLADDAGPLESRPVIFAFSSSQRDLAQRK